MGSLTAGKTTIFAKYAKYEKSKINLDRPPSNNYEQKYKQKCVGTTETKGKCIQKVRSKYRTNTKVHNKGLSKVRNKYDWKGVRPLAVLQGGVAA